MKYIIAANNIKCFAKTIHCLCRLGNDIYLDCDEGELLLKTLNASRSTFALFVFPEAFFELFEPAIQWDKENPYLKCKISVKTFLQVFRSVSFIERSVETCEIILSDNQDQLIFTLNCRHAVVKTFQLNFEECESLKALYSKDLSPNKLIASSKLLQELFANFPSSLDEVSLSVSPCRVIISSFTNEDESGKTMSTEMTLNPQEFTYFQVGVDSCVSFSLKDLRPVLGFAESFGSNCKINFEHGGQPFVLEVAEPNCFTANFVLATISGEKQTQSKSTSVVMDASVTSRESTRKHNHCNTDGNVFNKKVKISKQNNGKDNLQPEQGKNTGMKAPCQKNHQPVSTGSTENYISAFVRVKDLFSTGMQQSWMNTTILAADSDDSES